MTQKILAPGDRIEIGDAVLVLAACDVLAAARRTGSASGRPAPVRGAAKRAQPARRQIWIPAAATFGALLVGAALLVGFPGGSKTPSERSTPADGEHARSERAPAERREWDGYLHAKPDPSDAGPALAPRTSPGRSAAPASRSLPLPRVDRPEGTAVRSSDSREPADADSTRVRPAVTTRPRTSEATAAIDDDGAAPGPLTRQDLYLLLQDVDDFAREFRFDRALELIDAGLSRCSFDDIAADFRSRRADLEAERDLHSAVVARLDAGEGRARSLRLRAGGRIEGADAEGIRLDGGVLVRWSMVDPSEFVAICDRIGLADEEKLALAVFCFDHRSLEARAHRLLEEAASERPESRPEIDRILSRKLGIETPEGGFRLWEHRWVTPHRWNELASAARIAELRTSLRGEDDDARRHAFEELRGLGEPGIAILTEDLPAVRDAVRAKLEATATYRSVAGLRGDRERLERLRTEILGLVFDLEKYPSVYKAHEASEEAHEAYLRSQEKIDRLLQDLYDLWNTAETRRVAIPAGFAAGLARTREIAAWCKEMKIPPTAAKEPRLLDLLLPEWREVTLRNFPLYEDDVAWWTASQAALAKNREYRGVARPEELELVAVTNEYRMQLGRRALAADDRLMLAAQAHSEEMSTLGFFAHESPVPEHHSPSDRVRLTGYDGTGIGENIARGKSGARAAHELWLRSPPHHRNILSSEWNEQGAGRSGVYWTSDFGRR